MNAPVVIVANPYSGARENRQRVRQLIAALKERGIESRTIWDSAERAAFLDDPKSHSSCRCVVAAGGDGTVANVVNHRPKAPTVILPLGTENNFAKYFGFTEDMSALAGIIAEGHVRTVDLGRAGDRFFTLMVSVGIDADIVHRVARWRAKATALKRVTYWSYAMPILASLRHYPFTQIELDADGVMASGVQVFVFNTARYSLGLPILPHAKCDDGWLDWIVLKRPGVPSLLSYFWAICHTRHLNRPDVRFGRARRLRITARARVPVQTDGDPAGWTPMDVEVIPQAFTVLTPADGVAEDAEYKQSPA